MEGKKAQEKLNMNDKLEKLFLTHIKGKGYIPKHIFKFYKSVRKGTKTQQKKWAKDINGLQKNKYKWLLNI